MRYLLAWQLFTFDPVTSIGTWNEGMEVHLHRDACKTASAELYALTKMRGYCWPENMAPVHFGTTTTSRYFLSEDSQRQIMLGTPVNGKYVSRHIKGGK